jgi:hypothetical protein
MIGTTDLSTPETRAEVDYLRLAIEYAPADPRQMAANIVGWWTTIGNWVCAHCAGRIIARGCRFPPALPHWKDDVGPRGVCCCCDK